MNRNHFAGVLVALAAFGGAGAADAAANASFYECAKLEGGKYGDKACTKPAAGKYELKEGVGKGKAFKGKAGAVAISVPALKLEMACAKSKSVISPTSPSTLMGTMAWSKCQSGGSACSSPGAKPGVVESEVDGEVGTIVKPKGPNRRPFAAGDGIGGVSVGLRRRPKDPEGTLTFTCGGSQIEVGGKVIGEVTEDVGQLSNLSDWVFAPAEGGLQQWGAFEGGPAQHLEVTVVGVGTFEGVLTLNDANKGEKLDLKI